jgi:branched-chain amino acid transport system ATP-binding protein
MRDELMFKANKVSVSYGKVRALDDVSLNVGKEELVAVIGPNGAGKTTLANAIIGLVQMRSGTLEYGGERIDHLPTHKRVAKGIALCPERKVLAPSMTVIENLELGAYLRKDKEVSQDLDNMFKLFPPLLQRKTQPGRTLSGGELKMLTIGRALMSRPKFIIFDEPSLGLAPLVKRAILNKIREIAERKVAVLLIEQDVKFALSIASRAYVLEGGHVRLEGYARDLVENDYVREVYFGL